MLRDRATHRLRGRITIALVAVGLLAAARTGGSDGDGEGLATGAGTPLGGVVLTDVSELVKAVRDGVVSVAQAQFEGASTTCSRSRSFRRASAPGS